MRLIVRADDFGYTSTYNLGTLRALDEGIVTSLDIMLDTPGTDDALRMAREHPWVSVGWHAHFWGRPVLPACEVPSMVRPDGKFAFGRKPELRGACRYEEVLRESRAQLNRCLSVLGRVPDVASIRDDGTDLEAARRRACKEYGVAINVFSKPRRDGSLEPADARWEGRNIYMPNQPAGYYRICFEDSYSARSTYDPVSYYVDDYDDLLDREAVVTAWHPGYLDDYIMGESRMRECRVIDVAALTSDLIKRWVVKNGVELINMRDALYGTSEYQNHLRSVGSPLYVKTPSSTDRLA